MTLHAEYYFEMEGFLLLLNRHDEWELFDVVSVKIITFHFKSIFLEF